jgi:hypothetical protein
MTDSATDNLLATHDPRRLSSAQWKRYSGLIDCWLSAQGLTQGCSACVSGGTWEDFGTQWFGPDCEFMVNYMTMPVIASCIRHGKNLDVFLSFINSMRFATVQPVAA